MNSSNEWYLYPIGCNRGFETVQKRRRTWGRTRFDRQLVNNGQIDITDIGTATFLIANLHLKDESLSTF